MSVNIDIAKANDWYAKNLHTFDYWLKNVVIVPDEAAKQSPAVFQRFIEPVPSISPLTFLNSQERLYHSLMQHVFFGRHREGILYETGGEWRLPPMFGGFIERVGRFPTPGDQALFTATSWFHYTLVNTRPEITISGEQRSHYPALVINCSVDFFEKDERNQA